MEDVKKAKRVVFQMPNNKTKCSQHYDIKLYATRYNTIENVNIRNLSVVESLRDDTP